MQVYGIGPILKLISILFLCYVVYERVNIHANIIYFFVLHGIGSIIFMLHLLKVKKTLQPTDVKVDAGIYEQGITILLCVVMIIFLLVKK